MARAKKLYKGTFNWAGESYDLYTQAYSAEGAFANFTRRLSAKVGYIRSYVRDYFDGEKDNYYIEEVKDDVEL